MGATGPLPSIRIATAFDLVDAARLLRAFNAEFDEPAPAEAVLAERLQVLVDAGDAVLLVGRGDEPGIGVAVLRFRPALWSDGLECYLAELYVVPDQRGRGHGRALLTAALDEARRRGADTVDLGTSEDDVAARSLYESMGFTNCERPGGPIMYVYERDLGATDEPPGPGPADEAPG